MSWKIVEGPEEIVPSDVDSTLFRWTVEQEGERRLIVVAIANSLMASAVEELWTPIDVIVATRGRSAVEDEIRRDRTPVRVTVSSAGLWVDEGSESI